MNKLRRVAKRLLRLENTAIIGGGIAGLVVMLLCSIPITSLDTAEVRRETAEWGQPVDCSISDRSNIVTSGWYLAREVTVTCPGQPANRGVMMYQSASSLPTAQVWHNTQTGEQYIQGDRSNGISSTGPDRSSGYPWLMVPVFFIAVGVWIAVGVTLGSVRDTLAKQAGQLPSPA